MREGWEIKTLGEVCIVERGSSPRPIDKYITESSDGVNWIKIGDIRGVNKYLYSTKEKITREGAKQSRFVKEGDIILSNSMSFGNPIIVKTQGYIHDGWFVLRLPNYLDTEYLYYLITSPNVQEQIKFLASGAIVKNISSDLVKKVKLSYPKAVSEQKQIVEILDEAFAAIDKARANVEKNLQNAKELFEASLKSVFTNKREGWIEKRFDEVCVLQRGFDLPTRLRTSGKYPLVSSNGITDRINSIKIKGPGVVTGRSGTIGNVHYIEEDYWPLNTALYIKEFYGNYERFIYYFLKQFDLGKFSSGAGVPTLNRNNVHGQKVWIPATVKEQKLIVHKLDILANQSNELENNYKKKLNHLEELKRSILQKAFAVELNAEAIKKQMAKISPTDLQGAIISLALQKHQGKKTASTFGHVKAEKIVNTAQYFLNLDLDRNPIKDAAGPNDFSQLKKVESRAQKAGFFSVNKINGRHDYKIGSQVNVVLEKGRNVLGQKWNELEKLIDAFVPMDTQQAEIVATVFAAWNNLLIDKKPITDEAIVYEARENWHKNKLSIKRDRFFKAITWMKQKGLVPKGTGKKVLSKQDKS